MKKISLLIIVVLLITAAISCNKVEQVPARPSIEFSNFKIFDTLDILENVSKGGRLSFRFEDGDGNVGLAAPVTESSDTTNLHLTLYRKINGSMVRVTDKNDPLLPYSSYRIPYMERLGQNKVLRGTIEVTFIYQSYSPTDTIKYEFYIKDRAGNISNLAETSEIIVAKNDTYSR